MYKSLKTISKKQWFKVSSLSSMAIGVKFFTSLVNSKIMAYFLGPAGIAFIENIRNIFTSIDALATVGIPAGTTNDILQNKNSISNLYSIFCTSIWFVFIWACIICIATLVFVPFMAEFDSFNAVSYSFLIVLFALYPLVVLHLLFQAFLNGFEEYAKIIKANIYVGILSLVLNLILVYFLGIKGILLTIIILPILLLFYYALVLKSKIDLYEILRLKNFKPLLLKRYYKFSIILLLSGILAPTVYLAIRSQIISQLGWFEAGIWSALTRISTFYLIIPITLISHYFFPKVLKTNTAKRSFVYIRKYLILMIPFFLILFTVLYFTATYWIPIILTKEFLGMKSYLKFQFSADFLKIITLIFGNYFIAKKRVAIFAICEIISLGSFYLFSSFLIKKYNLQGVVMGYLGSIILYFITIIFFFIKELKSPKSAL